MLRIAAVLYFSIVSGALAADQTEWQLKPSLKYDALCLLNVLSGDPYYLHYYQREYNYFHPLFTNEEQTAFDRVKHVLKDEGGTIVSARLALYYSVVPDETLADMIRTARDGSAMKAALQNTSYWNEQAWGNYQAAAPALATALQALQRVEFPKYWRESVLPRVAQRLSDLTPDLQNYNIVPSIERLLGFPLPSSTITVYLLAYSEPHGIRITGLRFLTHVSYPFTIVLHNAIHESMHPPYRVNDPAVRAAIDLLGRDPLIADKVAHHDRSFGYNSAPGYVEEDSAQALEQIVSEEFRSGRDARRYWQEQDGGMHVLAAAIYAQYNKALTEQPQPFGQWFVKAVENGQLRGEQLSGTVRRFRSGE
jgi:hypothetical protein